MTRLSDRQEEVIQQLVQRVLKLEKWKRDITGDSPLFDIANEHTVHLGSDQNDYDPGFYDVLRILASADFTITGISRGQKGRFLELYNYSSYIITLAYNSIASMDGNRLMNAARINIRLLPMARVRLYYDDSISVWVINDLPGYRGDYGMSTALSISSSPLIPSGIQTKILFDEIGYPVDDPYGFADLANNQFVIPTGMAGFYIISVRGEWDPVASSGIYRDLLIGHTTGFFGNVGPGILGENIPIASTIGIPCLAGDTIGFYARQESGGDLTLNNPYATIARIW